MTFDDTGKEVDRITERLLVHTNANQLWYSHGKDKRYMTKILDVADTTRDQCIIIEGDGHLLYDSTTETFESERVGDYEKFNVQHIGGKG